MTENASVESLDLPAAYAKWRASELGRITDAIERRLLLDLVGPVAGKRVLDVGCGDGELAVSLARSGADVTGLDRDPRMLRAAERRAADADVCLSLVEASAGALPFAGASFDVVVSVTVLCFVSAPEGALAEFARVSRPGGRVVVGELGRYSSWAAERRLAGWLGSPTWRAAHFRSARELERLARGAGLNVEGVRGAVYYPPCGRCARWLAPLDGTLSRTTTFGAAFLALTASKPGRAGIHKVYI
jgi:2-polyprenyl-3-methyl-5-hydroxy-6-metoxy-1,4-benzoquinol methylase